MFHGFANVAFAYGGGETLAVDTSSMRLGAAAVAAIRKITDEPFAFLVYTHGHGDHAFGAEAFLSDNLARGYPRWNRGILKRALAIAEIALDADRSAADAIALNAEILEKMAAEERSFIARNFYLAAARDLRGKMEP